MRSKPPFVTVLAVSLTLTALAVSSPVAGEAGITPNYARVDTARWRCRLCPFEAVQGEGSMTAGAIHVDASQPRLGRDDGLDEAGLHIALDADYRRRDEAGRSVELTAADVGLDSRYARLRIGNGREWDVRITRRDTPRNVATNGRTPYSGRTSLTLPSDWVAASGTQEMTALIAGSHPFDYATKREASAIDLRLGLHPDWRLKAGYSHETKKGTEETYADFLYQATGLPKPIDYRTEAFTAGLSFDRGPFLAAAEFRSSRFRNDDRFLEWENPWAGRTVEHGRKALAPDNDAQSVSFVSRLAPDRKTTINAALTWGEMTQDDAFLPYTTNPALTLDPLPADSLDGRVRTFAGTFNVVSRLTDRMRVSLQHRRRRSDSDTGTLTLTPVLGDLFVPATRERRTHDFDKAQTGGRLRYRVARGVELAAGAETSRIHRSRLEITGNEEDKVWTELAVNDFRGFRLKLKRMTADRSASAFQDLTTNHPLTRRFYQAQRKRREWRADLDYHFASAGLSLGLDAYHRSNDYPDSVIGLRHDDDRGWGADFSYAPTARSTLSGFFTSERTTAATAGSVAFASPDWMYGIEDTVNTIGLTFTLREVLSERLDLSFGYVHSDGAADYDTEFQDRLSVFPRLVSEHRAFDVRARYRWRDRLALITRYRHEDYRSVDWALTDIGQDTVDNVISFGRPSPNGSAGYFSVLVEMQF